MVIIYIHYKQMVKRKAAPYCTGFHQFDDFPLGHNSVREVQTPVLPLHRAVQIQSVTQPEIRGTPCRKTKGTMRNETLLYVSERLCAAYC